MVKPLKFCMILIASSLFLQACSKHEPEMPSDTKYDNSENGNNDANKDETLVENLIQNNVSVTCFYSDYSFTFTIKSKLKSRLPYYDIDYGIGHGTVFESAYISVSLGKQAYFYSSSVSGDTETVTLKNPFWFYYVFINQDKEKWTLCERYYDSYMYLKEKGYSKLSSDEKNLYNEIINYLNECQKEVKYSYKPIIEVCVDNKFYPIQSFRMP